jgi:hypothetical protein
VARAGVSVTARHSGLGVPRDSSGLSVGLPELRHGAEEPCGSQRQHCRRRECRPPTAPTTGGGGWASGTTASAGAAERRAGMPILGRVVDQPVDLRPGRARLRQAPRRGERLCAFGALLGSGTEVFPTTGRPDSMPSAGSYRCRIETARRQGRARGTPRREPMAHPLAQITVRPVRPLESRRIGVSPAHIGGAPHRLQVPDFRLARASGSPSPHREPSLPAAPAAPAAPAEAGIGRQHWHCRPRPHSFGGWLAGFGGRRGCSSRTTHASKGSVLSETRLVERRPGPGTTHPRFRYRHRPRYRRMSGTRRAARFKQPIPKPKKPLPRQPAAGPRRQITERTAGRPPLERSDAAIVASRVELPGARRRPHRERRQARDSPVPDRRRRPPKLPAPPPAPRACRCSRRRQPHPPAATRPTVVAACRRCLAGS